MPIWSDLRFDNAQDNSVMCIFSKSTPILRCNLAQILHIQYSCRLCILCTCLNIFVKYEKPELLRMAVVAVSQCCYVAGKPSRPLPTHCLWVLFFLCRKLEMAERKTALIGVLMSRIGDSDPALVLVSNEHVQKSLTCSLS